MSERLRNTRQSDSTGISSVMFVLDMLSIQLADIAQDVESSVTGVCSGFQSMGNRARTALGTAADALDSSADGGGLKAFVHRVGMALEVMLQRIESSRDFSNQLSDEIEKISERLEVIRGLDDQFLRICELAKTASADGRDRLIAGGDCRPEMATLVEKTMVLANAAHSTNQTVKNIVTGLGNSIRQVSARVKCKAEEDQDATVNSENTVRTMLDKLSSAYDKMTNSLSSSAAMSRQLNLDIGQAVMSMQFQDRVNQRIQHLVETIAELRADLQPFAQSADQGKVQMLSEYWLERAAEKATMKAERIGVASGTSDDADEGSIELF